MIFNVDKSIVNLQDRDLNIFGKALMAAVDNYHFIELPPSINNWFEDTYIKSRKFLGELDAENLKDSIGDSPDGVSYTALTSIKVGDNTNGTLSPSDMLILASERSIVVLENANNDWYVYERWVELYRNDRGIKTIVEKVHRAISKNYLIPDCNGGGDDAILSCIDRNKNPYGRLYRYKITSIFDSDKTSLTDTTDHHVNLKQGLGKSGIEYHELIKREVENYFPLEVYKRLKLVDNGKPLPNYTDNDWDYVDIGKCKFIKVEKKDVKMLSKALSKEELDSRIKNNPPVNGHNEVQRVIWLLAKYI